MEQVIQDFISSWSNVNNTWIVVLLCLMAVDMVSGILSSLKYKTTYSSILYNGIMKKVSIIVSLTAIFLIDTLFVFDSQLFNVLTLIFCGYESLSSIENLGKCGVPFPQWIIDKLYALQDLKQEDKEDEK